MTTALEREAPTPAAALAQRLAALPYVDDGVDARLAAGTDRSGLARGPVIAVARPTSVDEVQEVVRQAWATRTPVVARGAGTGLAGGATPVEASLVLDLTGLDRIGSIDVATRTAVVEPGVITADLDRAARDHGLQYSPDPASAAISTIGGNIATNAGGLRCLKYGVTRDSVRSLDVVLADGRLLRTGPATAKSSAGYDLTRLFVGSEGTLGVIVGATVSLVPAPAATSTLSASFRSFADAADAVVAALAAGVTPSVMEVMDGPTVAAARLHLGEAPLPDAGAQLVVQTDGRAAGEEIEAVRTVVERFALSTEVTGDSEEASRLLRVRRAALPALETLGTPFIEDICVPVDRLAEAWRRIVEISSRHDVRIFTFAHAGDGNIHPIIVADHGRRHPPRPVLAAADDLFALAIELGGTITGEHGVGVLKRAWLHREADPVALGVQHAIKSALDPHGLLNPGTAI